jgi:secreted trypsin-like serine protease
MIARRVVAAGLMSALLASCATSDDGGRIINGMKADYGTAPWQVFLRWQPRFGDASGCGAVLIRADWVLTARHCVQGKNTAFNETTAIEAITLSAGHLFIDGGPTADTKLVQTRRVDKVRIPETSWKVLPGNFKLGDIALLHVSQPFDLNRQTPSSRSPKTIELPPADRTFPRSGEGQISGWGLTKWAQFQSSPDSEMATQLFYAPVDILPADQCPAASGVRKPFPDALVCAWKQRDGDEANSTTCQGDSGGPLVLMEGQPVLVGIVSGAIACGPKAPVFTRVSYYIEWIQKVMAGTI